MRKSTFAELMGLPLPEFPEGTDVCRRLQFSLWNGPVAEEAKTRLGVTDQAGLRKFGTSRRRAVLRRSEEVLGDESENLACLEALPAVTPVLTAGTGESVPGLTDNLEVVLAVVARSSAKCFVREKSPVVSVETLLRTVTLIVPPDWEYGS